MQAPLARLLVLLVLALSTPARAGSEQFTHRETGVVLPVKIAGLICGETRPYAAKAGPGGVMMPFTDGETTATVYFRAIAPGEDTSAAAVVESSVAAIRELENRGMYSQIVMLKTAAESEGSPWASAAFVAQAQGQGKLASFVYARIRDGYVIKLRITTPNSKSELVTKFVDEFRRRADAAPRKPSP
jgi:hypothetical protein